MSIRRFFRNLPEKITWFLLNRAAQRWSNLYMDQWEKIKFRTKYDTVCYLTISLRDQYPESFEGVDKNGNPDDSITE
jgi:hypothetical protein